MTVTLLVVVAVSRRAAAIRRASQLTMYRHAPRAALLGLRARRACTTISRMLNYIWFGLMAIALVVAAINGTPEAVTKGAVESATTAVTDRDRPRRHHDALARHDARGRSRGAGDARRTRAAAAAAMAVSRRAARASGRRRDRARAGREHAGAQQRRDAARDQGDGGAPDAQSRQGHRQQRHGDADGGDHRRRPAHSRVDDRRARRRRLHQPDRHHRPDDRRHVHRHRRRRHRREAAAALLSAAAYPVAGRASRSGASSPTRHRQIRRRQTCHRQTRDAEVRR